ncbi:F-box protein SKIP23-like [Spinacia oleracea]|uniref:F-box protein SKIP23-like n=1 Tax=Spinacia oleracea TaxID=3562 RepID=A0ABM3QLZ6_SPIOL|nr:F-box protein SKIP23-like [Spinacia oleracea]
MESINPKDHRKVSWSELPPDLLISIIERLDPQYDIFNLRRVCKAWKTTVSLTLVSKNILSPLIPQCLPFDEATTTEFSVVMGSVIQIQSLANPNLPPCLLTVTEINSGKLFIRPPLFKRTATRLHSDHDPHILPEDFPHVLDLSRFRVSELGRFHSKIRKIKSKPNKLVRFKAVLIKDPNCENWATTINNYTLVEMSRTQSLSATRLVASNPETHDVIFETKERIKFRNFVEFKGKIYAVDKVGMVYSMDYHTLKMSMITKVDNFKNIYYLETKKYLVVSSSSELYLVCRRRTREVNSGTFSVFKLNEEKKKWDKITSIGDDKILFVTFDGCFFVLANDFPGWKGNCIVFHYDKYIRTLNKYVVGVFHLNSGDYGTLDSFPGYSNVLWPPPSWLWTDTCSSTTGAD